MGVRALFTRCQNRGLFTTAHIFSWGGREQKRGFGEKELLLMLFEVEPFRKSPSIIFELYSAENKVS